MWQEKTSITTGIEKQCGQDQTIIELGYTETGTGWLTSGTSRSVSLNSGKSSQGLGSVEVETCFQRSTIFSGTVWQCFPDLFQAQRSVGCDRPEMKLDTCGETELERHIRSG